MRELNRFINDVINFHKVKEHIKTFQHGGQEPFLTFKYGGKEGNIRRTVRQDRSINLKTKIVH